MTDMAASQAPAQINVADFAALIANMSRLLTGLGRIKPFNDANLSLAEWVALSALAEKDGISNKHLGRNLGVTGQRANQLSTSLTKAGLIAVKQSAEDSRANEISITDAGRAKVAAVNSQLMPILAAALKGKERSLPVSVKQTRHMMRIVQAGTPETQEKKGKKKERKEKKAGAEQEL